MKYLELDKGLRIADCEARTNLPNYEEPSDRGFFYNKLISIISRFGLLKSIQRYNIRYNMLNRPFAN